MTKIMLYLSFVLCWYSSASEEVVRETEGCEGSTVTKLEDGRIVTTHPGSDDISSEFPPNPIVITEYPCGMLVTEYHDNSKAIYFEDYIMLINSDGTYRKTILPGQSVWDTD